MKKFFSVALLSCFFLCESGHAQKIEKYYSYDWKECDPLDARFYSVKQRTDSGWFRVDYYIGTMMPQMIGLYDDEACTVKHGTFKWYYANKNLKEAGRFFFNKATGVFLSFHYNGMMSDSSRYEYGELKGTSLSWHENGYIKDSIKVVDGNDRIHINWFNNGMPSFAGYYHNDKKNGIWNYFRNTGSLASKIIYKDGAIVSIQAFDEQGKLVSDTYQNTDAYFETKRFGTWDNYLHRKIFWPNNYRFSRGKKATVLVFFSIDENGKVENAYVDIPFHPLFDDIALKAVENSPLWHPQMEFNRPVKVYMRQLVTFTMDE